MSAKNNRGKVWITFLALVGILFVLPGVGWLYLQKGLDYQRSVRASLGDYGSAPVLPTTALVYGELPKQPLPRLSVVGMTDLESSTSQTYGEIWQKLHAQFGEATTIAFVTLFPATNDAEMMHDFIEHFELDDQKQQYFYRLPQGQYQNMHTAYHFPESLIQTETASLVALVDDSLRVRNHYDIQQQGDLDRLIQQIAILAPQETKPYLVFEREKEK